MTPSFYKKLERYLLSDKQLKDNNYPLPSFVNGRKIEGVAQLTIPENRKVHAAVSGNKRICSRCGKCYIPDNIDRVTLNKEKCVYHWGKLTSRKLYISGRGYFQTYYCCQGDSGQPGCHVCDAGHVNAANIWLDTNGFVTTALPPSPQNSSNSVNVYALDCEMIYTTGGYEIGRVGIVDSQLKVIMDKIIRPDNPIIDCNFKFSGLTKEQLENATERLTDIQAEILHLFDSDTILIGHSLESDLVALKLIHTKIVDTAIVFPHKLGPPKKSSLKYLVEKKLNKQIQKDEHDCVQDAVACMQLMQYLVL